MKKLWHTTNIYLHPAVHEYAEKLAAKMPGNLKVDVILRERASTKGMYNLVTVNVRTSKATSFFISVLSSLSCCNTSTLFIHTSKSGRMVFCSSSTELPFLGFNTVDRGKLQHHGCNLLTNS